MNGFSNTLGAIHVNVLTHTVIVLAKNSTNSVSGIKRPACGATLDINDEK
jgi:hypothetical protein